MIVADGIVGEAALLQTGKIQLAIPYCNILCLAVPQFIGLQVRDGIAVAAAGSLPEIGAQQHMALHQLAYGGAAPGSQPAKQPLTSDFLLLFPQLFQGWRIPGTALASLTPTELVAAIGALAFTGVQHPAAVILAFFGLFDLFTFFDFYSFLHTHKLLSSRHNSSFFPILHV